MAPRPSPQTDRLVSLIDAIAERPTEGLTLSEIARHLAVTPATCHPMLASLTSLGWLIRHPTRRTYRLGPALVTVGRAAARGLGVLDVARPVMRRLRDETGLTCFAMTPGERHVAIAEVVRAPGAEPHRPHIGAQAPITPPLGIGYVPWADEQTVRRWLDEADGPTARARMEHAIDNARRGGFAIELVTDVDTRLGETLGELDEHLEGLDTLGAGAAAARLRTLLEEIAAEIGGSDGGQIDELEADRDYRVGTISAPVHAPDGDLVLILSLRGFAPRTDGRTLEQTGRLLAKAAAEVAAAL
ncbi:IclR family transcriptional regulator [Embleya hyalina]|uniref:Putative transcriptional regulator, IclR family protein n=1 Tax=Embleya hyalina TaxID=516124 RepID=A0A401YWL3_9ACTN|nr:helix-turn-helix domain-containing protein [Embleya hyalina]GCD98960.1 putative transcriptional regulator, IclR family protein [Embleya hyalina]